jgi:hypothetical protein
MRQRLIVLAIAGAFTLLLVSLAGGANPSATLLVLQPEDTPGWSVQTAPQLTSNDGAASVSVTKYGRVSGAVSSYSAPGLLGGLPWSLSSRAVVFRDATGAHGAFLELSGGGSGGSTANIGQEGRYYETAVAGIRNRDYKVLWRQGNVLALVQASGEPVALKTQIVTLPQRQQARIAALIPAADPGPPIVVKPVIGRPVAQPAQPTAGKAFGVTFRVTWSSDGTPVAGGTLTSVTRIAGKTVPHGYSFRVGQISVTLRVPKTARGKQLKITVRVVAEKQAATKVVAYKVR